MNPPSSFYNDFKAELVSLGAWVSDLASQGTEEAKDELLAELIQVCMSSREDRVRVYEKFVSDGLICPFEMLMMEIDYCSYVDFVQTCVETLYLQEASRVRASCAAGA